MLGLKLVCAGRLKEKYFSAAAKEYEKRLSPYYKYELTELPERSPSGDFISAVPKGAFSAAMCIEGEKMDSEALAAFIDRLALSGKSRLCFIIGGSDGLPDSVKAFADMRLSMSDMTFPHHFARIMLLEQLYRAATISGNANYHK
jgi:23S rRNA (pseudouridine1915-N3)-methyltransferase